MLKQFTIQAARQPSFSSDGSGLREEVNRLRRDVARWLRELSAGKIRGTLRHGIAKWAVESTGDIVPPQSGKPLENLTLGELIQHLERNDKTFTAVARRDSCGTKWFRDRRVMGRLAKQPLDRILKLRNLLHHHSDQFAADDDTLQANTINLLTLLSDVMTDALFEYAVDRSCDRQCH